MKNTISRKDIRRYVEARYPGSQRNTRVGGWHLAREIRFIFDSDAKAEAEVELARDGIAKMPEWLSVKK